VSEKTNIIDLSDEISNEVGCEAKHVRAIINIFIDEVIIEIKEKGTFSLPGLGEFVLRKMKDHKHHDINNPGEFIVSPGRVRLRLDLTKLLSAFLISHLSRRKTFPPKEINPDE
jgi:nucleoid DNA-binding protein